MLGFLNGRLSAIVKCCKEFKNVAVKSQIVRETENLMLSFRHCVDTKLHVNVLIVSNYA